MVPPPATEVPLLIAISDQVWIALITLGNAIVVMIGASYAGWLAIRKLQVQALKLDEIKEEQERLVSTNKEIARDTKATVTLQNHQYGVALEGVAIARRSMAELTKRNGKYDKADLSKAEAAEEAYEEHKLGQAKVDAQAVITRSEEQARKLLQEQREYQNRDKQEKPAEDTQKSEIEEEVAKQIEASTQTIEGTVQLTPVDEEKDE